MADLITWITAHQGVVAAAAVGLLDLAFALFPKIEANGILHQLYLWAKSVVKPAA